MTSVRIISRRGYHGSVAWKAISQNQHVSLLLFVIAGGSQCSHPSSALSSTTASCFHFFACLGGVSNESSPCISSRRRLGGLPTKSAPAPKWTFSLPSSSKSVVAAVVTAVVVAGSPFGLSGMLLLLLVVAVDVSEASCREDDSPTVAFSECKLWVLSPLLILVAIIPLAFLGLFFFGRFGEGSKVLPFLTAHSISMIL